MSLIGHVLSIVTGRFPHVVPEMRSGPGILCLKSHCCDQGREWILFSPTNVTGAGPYLVRGLSKVLGTGILLQWSCEWE